MPRGAQNIGTTQLCVVTNWRDRQHQHAGGAELVCEEMAARLARAGYEVVLLCAKVAGRPDTEFVDGYTIRRAGGRFTVYVWALVWLLLNRQRVSLVIDSQNGIPFLAPLVLRRRTTVLLLIHHVHQEQFGQYFSRPVAALGRWLEAAGCRTVYARRMVVAVSPSTRHAVRTQLKLRGEIRVIPPGWRVSLDISAARPPRTSLPTIVCVGRLVAHKRIHLLIEAVAELRAAGIEIALSVVGSGPELPVLREMVARFGIGHCVTFHTDCSDKDRDELVSSAWLAVNPSVGEGWGISVIEANAVGVPVLAFRRPGLKDSIRDGVTGRLIEEGSSLSGAIGDFLYDLVDLDFAAGMSMQAMEWAQNFTWDEMALKLLTVIAIEQRRLNLPHPDRRRQTDVATVIHIPAIDVESDWTPNVRIGDAYTSNGDSVSIFLPGADTEQGSDLAQRAGLPATARAGDLTARIARRNDYLLPFGARTVRRLGPP